LIDSPFSNTLEWKGLENATQHRKGGTFGSVEALHGTDACPDT